MFFPKIFSIVALMYGFLIQPAPPPADMSLDQTTEIYGSWQLLRYENTDNGALITDYLTFIPKNNTKPEQFYIHLDKEGQFSYNLDVNGCGTSFATGKGNTITIGEEGQSHTCTAACCDSVGFNYASVKQYKIEGDTLYLYIGEEAYIFKRV